MVRVVQLLLIHHSKQEIMFLHPDKSSPRHLLNTLCLVSVQTLSVLCVRTGKTGTHIYSQFMCVLWACLSFIMSYHEISVDVLSSAGANVPTEDRQCLLSQLIN